MADNSVAEIIGGVDNGGGIPQSDGENRAELAGGNGVKDELWLQDLELGNTIFGTVAISKVLIISLIFWVYYPFFSKTVLTSYYWWVWFSSMLVIYIAWTPVAISWLLMVAS